MENGEGSSSSSSRKFKKKIKKKAKKLFESVGKIEHEKTLGIAYADYFDQRVKEFERIEKHIGSFLQSFSTNENDDNDIQIDDVKNRREEFLFTIKESFDYIKTEGFGMDGQSTSQTAVDGQSTSQTAVQMEPMESAQIEMTTDGDNFSDYILSDVDNCDNGAMGYGKASLEHSLVLDESQFVIEENDDMKLYQTYPSYRNTSIPHRLRFKRHFSLTTISPSSSRGAERSRKRKRKSKKFY